MSETTAEPPNIYGQKIEESVRKALNKVASERIKDRQSVRKEQRVVTSQSLSEFESKVNVLLESGWKLTDSRSSFFEEECGNHLEIHERHMSLLEREKPETTTP